MILTHIRRIDSHVPCVGSKHKPGPRWEGAAIGAGGACLLILGCATPMQQDAPFEPTVAQVRNGTPRHMIVEATAYCPCGECCNWRRSWLGLGPPVIASGPSRGRPKAVGITASGTRARRGTVAADLSVLPFGTVLYVPGYGWGRVEDTGASIRGQAIDLFFDSHDDALRWGRRRIRVEVWSPSSNWR